MVAGSSALKVHKSSHPQPRFLILISRNSTRASDEIPALSLLQLDYRLEQLESQPPTLLQPVPARYELQKWHHGHDASPPLGAIVVKAWSRDTLLKLLALSASDYFTTTSPVIHSIEILNTIHHHNAQSVSLPALTTTSLSFQVQTTLSVRDLSDLLNALHTPIFSLLFRY
jgi:hypothetical protein